jgi:hypothetical protein
VTEAEVNDTPFEFVKLTVTPVTGLVVLVLVVEKVNGIVKENALPKAFDRESPYQVVKALPSWMVVLAAARLTPEAAVKLNCALVISRVVE